MPPNIVWLTIDALRYDYTSMSGERDLTPNIDAIADQSSGQTFSRCFSHGIGTRTSSSSILTGTYPSTHKVYGNTGAIPDELETVPELFSRNGYRTVGISPNVHFSNATNLDRGFDEFHLLTEAKSILSSTRIGDIAKFLSGIRKYSAGLDLEKTNHSLSYLTNCIAKRSLSSESQPVFAYIHYLDPHSPYRPPAKVFNQICEDVGCTPEKARSVLRDRHENGLQWTNNYNKSDVDLIEALYSAEIRFIDKMVGELIDTLEDDTIVIVTADHGELFGEDNVFGHRLSVHPKLTNVPLVTRGIDILDQATTTPVQHTDVVRTILEDSLGTRGDVQGVDLRTEIPNRAIVERGPLNFDSIPLDTDLLRKEFFSEHLYGVAAANKYGVFEDGEAVEWFDLDAGEYCNISADHRSQLTSAFKRWQTDVEQFQFNPNHAEMDERSKERLRELGYLID